MKHKHSEVIKAFADGIECEYWCNYNKVWRTFFSLTIFEMDIKVRIKPEPKPNVEQYLIASQYDICDTSWREANLKLTWDGETGKLKLAEVIKNV